jgi:hypothetical protein
VKKLIIATTIAALTVTGAALTAQPALAGPNVTCASGHACLYENTDFNRGTSDHWRDFTTNGTNFSGLTWLNPNGTDSNDGMNDETSSVINKFRCITLWQNANFGGAHTDIPSGQADGKLSDNGIGDNRASSIAFHFDCR